MNILIISLPESTDRRASIESQLAKAGITRYRFIDAVKDTVPVHGCMKSHRQAWAEVEKLQQVTLILEDDAILHDSFYHHYNNRIKDFTYWGGEVGLLGYQPKTAEGPVSCGTFYKTYQNVTFNGAYGYLVSPAGAKKLLELSKNVPAHPDLFFQDAANRGELRLLFMNLPLVQHGGFASTLEHHKQTIDTGHKTQDGKQPETTNEQPETPVISIPTAPATTLTEAQLKKVKISLIHPSRGRAQKAQQTYDYWLKQSSGKIEIEHVLSIDSDDAQKNKYFGLFPSSIIKQGGNTCVVEAANVAAKLSTGNILIYLSDDFKCPENWDMLLAERFAGVKTPMLLQVRDGINEFGTACLTIPVMNRLLYKKLGYFWHPNYRSMFVDNDLFHTCQNNNWLTGAPDLVFEHEHWVNKKAPVDETYTKSEANWKHGEKLFNERKAQNFPL